MKDRIDGAFFLPGVGFFLACVGWGGREDENGGTKINPERRLPTETLGVEII